MPPPAAMSLVDVNGNGDGWNNVSPFGDNGNGAYVASPNGEQAYGYGGAWGYLYFNAIFSGMNTVRSVDLYYIHGRWWHPDMGLFLSPNDKGDYLFGGDGPDPVNKGWVPLLMPQLQLPNNGYINTPDYGFLDIRHMNEARDVTNTILEFMNDMTKPNPLPLTAVGTGKAGAGRDLRVVNYFEGLNAWYDINRPVPTQLQDKVALGILLDYERRWENLQGRSITQAGSSYSPEDLPSDYLGFYSAISGMNVPVVLDDILKGKGKHNTQNDKPWWLDSRTGRIPNKTIDPVVCRFDWGLRWDWGEKCATNPWPDMMRIREETQGIYWQLDHCEGYSTLDLGPFHRRDPNLGCR
jgi:hypothetical protein